MPPYLADSMGSQTSIRQCAILTGLSRRAFVLETIGTPQEVVEVVTVDYAVVLTQDCDLEQDYRVRFTTPTPESDKLIPCVFLVEAYVAQDICARIADSSRKKWDRLNIEANKNERFHFLQKVDTDADRLNQGLPELVLDFKRYFTLPTDELYRRIDVGQTRRRTLLASPYLEHLSGRFAYYLSRVGLPTDHLSE